MIATNNLLLHSSQDKPSIRLVLELQPLTVKKLHLGSSTAYSIKGPESFNFTVNII
jgi:hypothetical protein